MDSTHDFEAIGTRWQIETDQPLDDVTREAVAARIEEFDRTWSRFREDSLVSRLAREGGRVEFPADAVPLFALYDLLADLTDGAVDPLVGRELERLGYDPEYSFSVHPERPVETRRWRDLARMPLDAGVAVEAGSPVLIDVGAAGKGHLVDIVSDLLADRGYAASVVDGSGDLRHRGGDPLRIGLEHPLDTTTAIGVAVLGEGALCASAGNRRAWGDGVHHILDARTGNPAREILATWVVARTALEADGLATALFFTRAHTLATGFHFSYVRMYADGRAEISRDFDGELFT